MNPDRPLAYSYLRMSTDAQLKGDSRRRQLEQSLAYAEANNLDLQEGAQLQDIGISAFRGANIQDGALGAFFRAIKEGKVSPESFLLVESLDRLSRQQVLTSLSLFLEIINAGVNIVTLTDNKVYTREKVDVHDLIMSLTIMSRAHEESRTKSQRVGAAWANKRANAGSKPLTKLCPAWLKLRNDRSGYEVVPERAAIVRAIFEYSAGGLGNYAITREFNRKGVPTFGSSNGWYGSYINKIVASRAVLGEFQPCTVGPNGKRTPAGHPIAGYFPRIVEDELFYRAQQGRVERKITGKGRKGQYLTNLFSGLACCAYCGGRMQLDRKGPGPKGGSYLVCAAARRGMGCITNGWRYLDFERSFLALVEKINLPSLIRNDDPTPKQLDDEIQSLMGRKAAIQEEMEKAYALLAMRSDLKFVADKLSSLQEQLFQMERHIAEKSAERQTLVAEALALSTSKTEIRSLVETMQTPAEEGFDLYRLRAQVADRIRSLISSLTVAPVGIEPRTERAIAQYQQKTGDTGLADMLRSDIQRARYFAVGFKNGDVLTVYPNPKDPLQFKFKIVGSDSGIDVVLAS